MVVVNTFDPRDRYSQATLLTVRDFADSDLGYQDNELVGELTHNGASFALLPHWGFTVNDFLCGATNHHTKKSPYIQALPALSAPSSYDSLLLTGPRWYLQPGQNDEVWHDMYLYWPQSGERGDYEIDLGLDSQVDLGLESLWTPYMTRLDKGYLVGQAIVSGKLMTYLTLVNYSIRNKNLPCDKMYLKSQRYVFEGNQPPEKLAKIPGQFLDAQEAVALFEQHCTLTDIGDGEPYWKTLYEDLAAECKAATQHLSWPNASDWIATPWDVIAYSRAWAYAAGIPSPDPVYQTERIAEKLWKHLTPERQDQLGTLWQWAYHLQHAQSRMS